MKQYTHKHEYPAHFYKIAQLMGEGWIFTPTAYEGPAKSGNLQKGNQKIWITADHYDHKGKIHLSGHYPASPIQRHYHAPGNEKLPSINVSETRTAAEVVSEIKRRFLPDYLHYLELAEKLKAEQIKKWEELTDKIAELFPALVPPPMGEDYKITRKGVSIDARICRTGTFYLQISGDINDAFPLNLLFQALRYTPPNSEIGEAYTYR